MQNTPPQPPKSEEPKYLGRDGQPVRVQRVPDRGFPQSVTRRKKKYGDKRVIGFADSALGDL